MNNNEMNKPLSTSRDPRIARAGTKALVMTAIVLVAVILINLLVSLIPPTLTRLDVTDNKLHSLSAVTKRLLASLDEDVTIYVVCDNAHLDTTPGLMLEYYTAASRHIKVVAIDPEDSAQELAGIVDTTSLTANSMIVQSVRRHTILDFANSYYYYIENLGAVTASQYSQLVSSYDIAYYYYENYGVDVTAATPYYDLESQLSQAIEYVVAPTVPHMYLLAGSTEPGLYMNDFIMMAQPEYETLSLSGLGAIPDDAAPLLIYAPANDLSAEETAKVKAFVQGGGKLLLITSPENVGMPNLMSIAAEFGVSGVEGIIHEGNANNYKETDTALLPTVNSQHDVTYSLVSYGYGSPLMPNAHGIAIAETLPAGVSVTTLFSTSSSSYLIDAAGNETEVGNMALGVAATHATTGASLVWMSSADAMTDETVSANDTDIVALYYASMGLIWQSEEYVSTLNTIEPVNMSESTMTVNDTLFVASIALLIVIIPAALLVAGISIRASRRRK